MNYSIRDISPCQPRVARDSAALLNKPLELLAVVNELLRRLFTRDFRSGNPPINPGGLFAPTKDSSQRGALLPCRPLMDKHPRLLAVVISFLTPW